MVTYRTPTAARAALTRAGYAFVTAVQGRDCTRYGYSRGTGAAVRSAVLTVYSATCATVRYL